MREILFRGKMKYTERGYKKGTWVYGDLVHFLDKRSIYYFGDVIPETVGQYTGMTDKNGVKIFEGDIVKSPISKSKYFKIVYDGGAFYLANPKGTVCIIHAPIEVVGNIYDNPELLGSQIKEGI